MAESKVTYKNTPCILARTWEIYWIIKFSLFPLGLTIPFLLFLFLALTLGVPFMGYYYTRIYRIKNAAEKSASAMNGMFSVFMYMFAALLTAVAHYIYFRFIDHGYIINTYTNILNAATQNTLPGMDSYITQIKEAMNVIKAFSPTDITLQLLSQNVFYCSILAIPTALIVMKKKKNIE
jgi:hypothetical protein